MTVKTMKSSGGDFSTLAGWIGTYLPATLTAPEQLDIYKTTGADYDENNAITGITTTSTNRLIINVPSAQRGNGTPHSGAFIKNASGGLIRLGGNIDFITVDGLELHGTSSQICWSDSNGSNVSNQRLIQHCFFHSNGQVILFGGSNPIYIFRNDIIYCDGSSRPFDSRTCASVEVSNCTFFNRGTDLGTICGGETTMKNTYSGGSATGDFWTGGSPAGNNNSSSDTTATNRYPTGSINSIAASSAFTSTTSGSEDFRTKTSFTSLSDVGATLAAVTDDYIGTARPQASAYDIGIFENIAAGGSFNPGWASGATKTIGAVY